MPLLLTSLQFKQRWEQGQNETELLIPYSEEVLSDAFLPIETREFLLQVGLPNSAGLFLSFEAPSVGTLEFASAAWHLSPAFDRYRIIGFNGSGDPVCIDEDAQGQVVYLNHDNHFERVLMGSSIIALATCLLQYRDFPLEPGDALGTYTAESIDALFKTLQKIDPTACRQGGYWWQECQELLTL